MATRPRWVLGPRRGEEGSVQHGAAGAAERGHGLDYDRAIGMVLQDAR